MQLSDKMPSNVLSSSSVGDKQAPSTRKSSFKQSSFNQSTLFSLNGSDFLDLKAKGGKMRNQATSVTFVGESFLSSKGESGKLKNTTCGRIQDGDTKGFKNKSKYNFIKKIVAVSKKKLKNAKKFIMNIGNKPRKNKHKKSWTQMEPQEQKKK